MSLKSKEIHEYNGFEECKLDREKYAVILTNIINHYNDGFVLTINNEWGFGKTTFLRMWKSKLSNDGYNTFYFNAWENDSENNALTAILALIKESFPVEEDNTFKNILKYGSIIAKNVVPNLAKAIASKYIDVESFQEYIENSAAAISEIFSHEVNTFLEKKQKLKEFKDELGKFIDQRSNGKPFVFFVDELDRCRPNYSVEVLEQIKHFFSVDGIVFVLGIDKTQLGEAIKGVYNSPNINSDEYLRRFIDLEFSLPAPDIELLLEMLFEESKLNEFTDQEFRLYNDATRTERQLLTEFSNLLINSRKLNVRQLLKLFKQIRMVLYSFNKSIYIYPHALIFLVYLRNFDFKRYSDLIEKRIEVNDFQNYLKEFLIGNRSINPHEREVAIIAEASLTYFYAQYYYEGDPKALFKDRPGHRLEFNFPSIINKDDNVYNIVIDNLAQNRRLSIKNVWGKISLVDEIQFID